MTDHSIFRANFDSFFLESYAKAKQVLEIRGFKLVRGEGFWEGWDLIKPNSASRRYPFDISLGYYPVGILENKEDGQIRILTRCPFGQELDIEYETEAINYQSEILRSIKPIFCGIEIRI